jgi:hypothetical protein
LPFCNSRRKKREIKQRYLHAIAHGFVVIVVTLLLSLLLREASVKVVYNFYI